MRDPDRPYFEFGTLEVRHWTQDGKKLVHVHVHRRSMALVCLIAGLGFLLWGFASAWAREGSPAGAGLLAGHGLFLLVLGAYLGRRSRELSRICLLLGGVILVLGGVNYLVHQAPSLPSSSASWFRPGVCYAIGGVTLLCGLFSFFVDSLLIVDQDEWTFLERMGFRKTRETFSGKQVVQLFVDSRLVGRREVFGLRIVRREGASLLLFTHRNRELISDAARRVSEATGVAVGSSPLDPPPEKPSDS